MKKLKAHQNHLQAYLSARRISDALGDDAPSYLSMLLYIGKLCELEPKAVTQVTAWELQRDFPAMAAPGDGVFLLFEYPYGADDGVPEKELPGEIELEPVALYVEDVACLRKAEAGPWCGVGVKTLERWMAGELPAGERVPHLRPGREVWFRRKDLFEFMAAAGVGERWKYFPDYVEGDIRQIPKK